jgi:PKD domain
MKGGRLLGGRGRLVLLAAAVLAIGSPGAARADDSVAVDVSINGAAPVTVSLDCSANPGECDFGPYPSYPNLPGPPIAVAVPASVTAAKLVELVGCDPGSVTSLEVVKGSKPDKAVDPILTQPEIDPPTSFLNKLPAVFYDFNGFTATFRRPQRTATDQNGNDTLQLGSTLQVLLKTPPCLSVTATVDHSSAKVGATLHLTAQIGNVAPGSALSATWDFGDGQSTTSTPAGSGGSQRDVVTHAYKTAGTYSVTVTVDDALTGTGGSDTIKRIVIGHSSGSQGPGTHKKHKHRGPVSGSPHKQHTTPPPTTPSTQPPSTTPSHSHPPAHKHARLPATGSRVTAHSLSGTQVSGILISGSSAAGSAPLTGQAAEAADGPGGTTAPDGAVPLGGISLGLVLFGIAGIGAVGERRALRARWRRSI